MNLGGPDIDSAKRHASSGAGIRYDPAPKSQVEGGPHGRIDAHVAHGAADRQVIDLQFGELFLERGFPERIGEMFLNDRFSLYWCHRGMDFSANSIRQKKSGPRLD